MHMLGKEKAILNIQQEKNAEIFTEVFSYLEQALVKF